MKKRNVKADIVQSTLRLPRPLWVRINQIAASKNLSMQQAVQEAVEEYCHRKGSVEARQAEFLKAIKNFGRGMGKSGKGGKS